MPRNILILTESMKPFSNDWGSCQRVYYYSKLFADFGYSVFIITRNNSELKSGEYSLDNFKVISFDAGISDKNRKLSLRSKIIEYCKKRKFIFNSLKFIFRLLYSEPNVFRGKESVSWAKFNLNNILNFIKTHNIDLVIISGPPFGLFRLTKKLKKAGIKIVLDYRDPWNLWYEKFSFSNKYEKKAIKRANLIVTSTSSLCQRIIKKYGAENVVPILNGYDQNIWSQYENYQKHKNDFFVISYIGYILINQSPEFRDPNIFLDACMDFLSNHEDVFVQFIGVGDKLDYIKYKHENLIFKNSVPVEEAIKIMIDSNLLVAIHTASDMSGDYIVCGKIYDYLKSGNRILSVGNYANCNKDLIESNRAGTQVNNDKNDILKALENEYKNWKNNVKCSPIITNYSEYDREHQNRLFLNEINKLLGEIKND